MITEDYVSFETAKLLKEKGFEVEITTFYYPSGTFSHGNTYSFVNAVLNANPDIIMAPSISLAMKWLREVYGLHISLEPCYDYDSMHIVFLAFVQNVADVHEFMDGRKNVASHPDAKESYELAIKYCLENMI